MFGNESSFTVRPTSLKKLIWRKANTKFELRNLLPTFKSGYVSHLVWGAFCAHGRSPLVRINGTLKQEKYKEILQNHVISMPVQKYGSISDFVFQQDNCGPHKSKSVTSFLVGNNTNVMKWPAQSSVLNPIENTWAVLKRMIRERPEHPRNADHLFEILQSEWNSIPEDYFTGLVISLKTRATIVKSEKGRSVKY